ncbi:hypothetical protein BTURTLESOX_1569 [bacterium endosymbiont of Bathymodiolus sp. 5 South]|nr:hypothetical protein BTURTLESOX_1569 [bacterium endosymbiont of Bathymodiolus sp. 5 South]
MNKTNKIIRKKQGVFAMKKSRYTESQIVNTLKQNQTR